METLESDMSMQRGRGRGEGGGVRPKTRRKEEKREVSLDATLEEDSDVTDVSTPRAVNQSPSKPVSRRSSAGGDAANQSPAKTRRPASHQQTASETEDEMRAISAAKLKHRQSQSESLQTSDKEETTQRKRLKSPPPPPRPSSRGSPTTDLFRTRERRDSGASGRSHRRGAEIDRQDEPEGAGLRQRQGPPADRPRSRQGRGREPPLVLPGDSYNTEIAERVKEYESRSAASSDVEVGSSVTRASSTNSNRLKALQDEIERLKEGVAQANEKASQRPPAPPPQPAYQPPPPPPPSQPPGAVQNGRQEPEYYDPFDDPYGFMRMPRRRANSFSGGREREWDEWYWTLPQNRQYDGGDIPLGYAAADAYADNPRNTRGGERNTRENVKNRLRQKRMDRRARGDAHTGSDPALATPESALPSTQPGGVSVGGAMDEQTAAMYDYYVPSRYSAQGMRQQLAARGYFTTPSGAKIYSSTGEDGDNEEEEEEHVVTLRTGQQAGTLGAQTQNRPWYQIRRAPRPFSAQPGQFAGGLQGQGQYLGGRRSQSQEEMSHSSPGLALYGQTTTASQACPMCGGASYHTHSNYVHQPATSVPAHTSRTYRRSGSTSRSPPRQRSRSASHTRQYNGDRSRRRYAVREYSTLSDSDGEERQRRRSRSLSRGRSRGRSQHQGEGRASRRRRSDSLSDQSGDEEMNLDRSLSLSVDISRLTKKMLGTLRSELRRSKDKREFGSSYW
ncbi:serine/arginine repetitive matrix protein 2 [Aplysia californica]|uniref:Serine/arginine repetitive matrix protein 2 n=1 Tax=Aplysia californica TaxID=6500 RepID=A0ABM1ACT9_APLCA|nr:serine/arginine repetitive matrix protein 2 [Aplysia californica]